MPDELYAFACRQKPEGIRSLFCLSVTLAAIPLRRQLDCAVQSRGLRSSATRGRFVRAPRELRVLMFATTASRQYLLRIRHLRRDCELCSRRRRVHTAKARTERSILARRTLLVVFRYKLKSDDLGAVTSLISCGRISSGARKQLEDLGWGERGQTSLTSLARWASTL